MRTILRGLHDIWCAVTRRCDISHHDDPMIQALQAHEQDAYREAEASRQRQRNASLVLAGMSGDVQRHWARRDDNHVG